MLSYHFLTMRRPSGFRHGTRRKMTLSRIRRTSGSSLVTRWWASSVDICVAPTSVPWTLHVTRTTALPLAMRAAASASSSIVRGSASLAWMARCSSRSARVSGAAMTAMRKGFPFRGLPDLLHLDAVRACVEKVEVVDDLRPVGQLPVPPRSRGRSARRAWEAPAGNVARSRHCLLLSVQDRGRGSRASVATPLSRCQSCAGANAPSGLGWRILLRTDCRCPFHTRRHRRRTADCK